LNQDITSNLEHTTTHEVEEDIVVHVDINNAMLLDRENDNKDVNCVGKDSPTTNEELSKSTIISNGLFGEQSNTQESSLVNEHQATGRLKEQLSANQQKQESTEVTNVLFNNDDVKQYEINYYNYLLEVKNNHNDDDDVHRNDVSMIENNKKVQYCNLEESPTIDGISEMKDRDNQVSLYESN
jgi:hypothetical protein